MKIATLSIGDEVMVLSYVMLTTEEALKHKPHIISINPARRNG